MHIKDIKNKLKVLKKRAQGSVGTAIKVLTATVLGASILVGGYALTNEVVLPNTTEKVESMFAYSADADGNTGGSGTVEPTPEGPVLKTVTFLVYKMDGDWLDWGTATFNYEDGMTWNDWVGSDYCPSAILMCDDPDYSEEVYPATNETGDYNNISYPIPNDRNLIHCLAEHPMYEEYRYEIYFYEEETINDGFFSQAINYEVFA